MPLNAVTYLEDHGWQGKGVPLDGKEGRGLKKPLALPMKRDLKGLGKERDRATEWWDCLFEASAKSINIQVGNNKTVSTAIPVTRSPPGLVKGTAGRAGPQTETSQTIPNGQGSKLDSASKVSLVSQAKRDYARKMLMSGFVRGHEVKPPAAEEELARYLSEQESKSEEQQQVVEFKDTEPTTESSSKRSKEERKRAKEEKRRRKDEKRRKRKTAKAIDAEKKRKKHKGEKSQEKKTSSRKDAG